MNRVKAAAMALCVLLAATIAGADWDERESLPEARYGGVLVSDGVYLYYFGGSTGAWGSSVDDVWRYDPVADTWDARESMPQRVSFPGAGYRGGKIYVAMGFELVVDAAAIAGGVYYDDVQIYDVAGNTWTTGTSAPSENYAAATVVVNNKIHLLGGYDPAAYYNREDYYIYDTALDTWAIGDDLDTERALGAAWSDGTNIYLAGGNDHDIEQLAQTSVWSPATDGSWSDAAMADLPTPLAGMASAAAYDTGG
ncbi:MAG: hypothetical protein M5R36_28280 [Deltaproteobacteria bacterium]|nr:hypothetical protein [Deltaproteobacteria bacterium]